MKKIDLPDSIKNIIEKLGECGCEAFAVGGSVRDSLLGKKPSDWDICTSALPNQIKRCFAGYQIIDTGIAHGTVTVIAEGNPVEITTYRIDGKYSDNRRPEKVEFTVSLEEDLARRDVTINAMAYSDETGLIDPFGGKEDISKSIIRCVGHPDRRFDEDALRILRCLRFAAVLGFEIEGQTEEAMVRCSGLLKNISRERVSTELSKLIMGECAGRVICKYNEIIEVAVGAEVSTASDIEAMPKNTAARLALLFPKNTEKALRDLRYDNKTIRTACALSEIAGEEPPVDTAYIKRLLRNRGEETVKLYFEMKGNREKLDKVLKSGECFNIAGLAVTGEDLIEAGIQPGPEIGQKLNMLLEAVIEGKIDNEREALISTAGSNRP